MDGAATEMAVTGADGPTAPTRRARLRLRPLRLSAAKIEDGFWAGRQRVNREVAIPAAAEALERAGNFDNLRLAAARVGKEGDKRAAGRVTEQATGDAAGGYRGRLFADSEVYKWLEALAWEQAREPSEELARWQAAATALVAAAQAPDGYLNSYYQTTAAPQERFTDLAFGHEMYCVGHLIQAGLAQRRATGRRELLDVALRASDNLAATFGPGRRQGVCGHPGIETALVELYRLTGRADYLTLASYFVNARGHGLLGPGPFGPEYWQDREPVRDARTVEGHTVRALFLAAGVTDLAAETGEAALLDAALTRWDDMVSCKTYLTGGVGARWEGEAFGDPYELPPDRAYCETCAAHASVLWSWRLLLATGEARFADLIERTLYNAFAAGLSLAGDAYFYTNPLQLRAGGRDTSSRSARHGRWPWYHNACCPPNVMRTLSSLDHYLATADDDGIQLQQYATATVEHGDARLRVETEYPWGGLVEVTLLATPSREWTLSLRLPSWCEAPAASVNGQPVDGAAEPGGYLRLRRAWRPSDTIVLDLPMPPRRTVADERIEAVRGCVAIERGPLVYCVEQADQPDVDHVRLSDGALTVRHRPELLGGVHVIEALGSVFDASEHAGLPYHDGADRPITRPVQLTAIPYYAWANRTVGPMRVWIPSAEP